MPTPTQLSEGAPTAAGRRILFVLGANQIGGSERQAWVLTRGLRDRGCDARLVFLERPRSRASSLVLEGLPHVHLWSGRWTRRPAIWRFRSYLRHFQPDAMFLYNLEAMQHGVAAAGRSASCSLVGSVRGLQFTRVTAVAAGLRACARKLDAMTTNCQAIADALLEAEIAEPARVSVVPNAIAVPAEAPAAWEARTLDGPLILFAGSLKEVKAPEVFVEAAAHVRRQRPDASFLMAGDGPLRPQLLQQRAAVGLDTALSLPGILPAGSIPFGEAAIVVSCSWREGASNTLLEAFAHGTPVVASAVGGSVELVRDSQAGLLVPPGDAEALATALLQLLADPVQATAMQQRGRHYVASNCALERVVDRHLEIIDRLGQRREGHPR